MTDSDKNGRAADSPGPRQSVRETMKQAVNNVTHRIMDDLASASAVLMAVPELLTTRGGVAITCFTIVGQALLRSEYAGNDGGEPADDRFLLDCLDALEAVAKKHGLVEGRQEEPE